MSDKSNTLDVPLLTLLMQGYFHQDYKEVHGSVPGTIANFVNGEGPERSKQLQIELSQVLSAYPEEDEMKSFIRSLETYYAPTSYIEWIKELLKLTEAEIAKSTGS